GIVLDVEHGAVVVGEGQVAGGAADLLGEIRTGRQVAETEGVLATAVGVVGPGHDGVVLADLVGANGVVILAFGQRVDVEQDLFAGKIAGFVGALDRQRVHAGAILAPGVDRVVPAGLVARVVPPAAFAGRDRAVVLPDAADDLVVQPVLDRLER